MAGATCFVWFSNVHNGNHIHGKTLNISSTGAKTINLGHYSVTTVMSGTNTTAVANYGTKGHLYLYTGSIYYVLTMSDAYSDYSD